VFRRRKDDRTLNPKGLTMKSATVLGLGLLAFVSGAALAPALLSEDRTDRSHFWMDVQGAHRATATGRVAYGPVGRPGEAGASFTITLGAQDGEGAVVFTRLDGATPEPGRYAIANTDATDRVGGWHALYLAGSATKPEGVFQADAGMLEITSATEGRISGHFELTGTGFLADSPEDESRHVTVRGSFDSQLLP
jgi:hypothetical protein